MVSQTILGMFSVAIATAFFVGAGATVQYVGGSVLQIVMGSYFFQNVFSILYWKFRKPESSTNWYGDSPNKTNVWVRGLLYWIEQFCWYKGLEMVPIGNAEAILFLSPLTTVLMARLLLKETLPRLFPITCMITITGLAFIAQPAFLFGVTSSNSTDEANWFGVLFLVLCIVAWTGASLLVRTAPDAHWLQINMVSSFQAAYVLTPTLAVINHFILTSNSRMHSGDGNGTPATNADLDVGDVPWIDGNDFQDWDWSFKTIFAMFLAAIFEWLAIIGKIVGYQLGEATKVAWMEYFDIIFAFSTQMILFKRMPNGYEWIGAALLILTCIVSICEEKFFPTGEPGTTGAASTDIVKKDKDKYMVDMDDVDVPMSDMNPLLAEEYSKYNGETTNRSNRNSSTGSTSSSTSNNGNSTSSSSSSGNRNGQESGERISLGISEQNEQEHSPYGTV